MILSREQNWKTAYRAIILGLCIPICGRPNDTVTEWLDFLSKTSSTINILILFDTVWFSILRGRRPVEVVAI